MAISVFFHIHYLMAIEKPSILPRILTIVEGLSVLDQIRQKEERMAEGEDVPGLGTGPSSDSEGGGGSQNQEPPPGSRNRQPAPLQGDQEGEVR
ncbi:hypothetical protein CEXT_255551 [Caerostris extrusa]|uniref:Uncharacterized protein n=1 Tax=Caerostris extrusa TaxID=172846 RepID=A0AAV4YE77_CAEEX|nr:hypothetical protein CEXT_255551 [Caerostris extrusa]